MQGSRQRHLPAADVQQIDADDATHLVEISVKVACLLRQVFLIVLSLLFFKEVVLSLNLDRLSESLHLNFFMFGCSVPSLRLLLDPCAALKKVPHCQWTVNGEVILCCFFFLLLKLIIE